MPKPDPNIIAHLEWLGFVRPTGLVLSAPALVGAGAILNRRDAEGQRRLQACVEERQGGAEAAAEPCLPDFRAFAESVLGWSFSLRGYAGTEEAPLPEELEAAAPDNGEILRPDFAVRTGAAPAGPVKAANAAHAVREARAEYALGETSPWQLLVSVRPLGEDFDRTAQGRSKPRALTHGRTAQPESIPAGVGLSGTSAHGRMERLLRQTGAPAGLLFNGLCLRLISAPRGESSGWLDFRVQDMVQTAGRPICAAMRLLLNERRLLAVPQQQRLAGLLAASRKFQNEVSERLAEQVLHALYELLRGFQAAQDAACGELLKRPLKDGPDEVYRGLLTVVLRLVFLLYAEERDLLPQDETFLHGYSLANLHQRLREDAALHPDTMDQRYGAYAQLLALFRMVHDGARSGAMRLPPRQGALFDPDRYRFLEGRGAQVGGARQVSERVEAPLVADGTIYRVLEKLIVLDGERISYRALDVEHIGAVYQTMMGFRLETAAGRAIAIKAAKKHGAPATVDLEALLQEAPAKRGKWLQDRTDRKLTERVRQAVRNAETLEAMHAALDSIIDREATPDLVPAGGMVLQPSEERRRSGSHYTPRELTEPIVRTALEPILQRLLQSTAGAALEPDPNRILASGPANISQAAPHPPAAAQTPRTVTGGTESALRPSPNHAPSEHGRPPRPEQILDLKVCDPAMGSGAFLVEACRQLADALVASWHAHNAVPDIPPDENELVFARRLVAQRCLYGVDRNPAAVDLAKLSLWLITLAKDHPLTFLDHALRHGDALLGLTKRQIESFHWQDGGEEPPTGLEAQRSAAAHLGGLPVRRRELQTGFEALRTRKHLGKVASLRQRIRTAGEEVPDHELRLWWSDARAALDQVRVLGDLALAAFFEGAKPKQREDYRRKFANEVQHDRTDQYLAWLEELANADPPLAPFHWEIEFPEVFERENAGFDAVVGNPPFAGKNTVAAANVPRYPDWLKALHPQSHGNADLVAHFFRRAFTLIRAGGAFGLIATNTIAQGDTRATGLRWICEHGGEIYDVHTRVKWPGLAAVVVSVLHVAKGRFSGQKRLDGKAVEKITAFLFHRGGNNDPARLKANAGKSFQGSIVLGMGFTFDDSDRKGVATPLAELRRLLEDNPRNKEAIFPYIGGEEVNTSPTHAHHRYVINFRDYPLRRADAGELRARGDAGPGNGATPGADTGQHDAIPSIADVEPGDGAAPKADVGQRDAVRRISDIEMASGAASGDPARHRGELWAEADAERRRELRRQAVVPEDYPGPVAADWPELLGIVEERVKPQRDALPQKNAINREATNTWWRFLAYRRGLHGATVGLKRVLVVNCGATPHAAFAHLPVGMVYANTLAVLAFDTHAAFSALQSRPHEIWTRFFGSSMKDDLRYTPSDCFETFPFPDNWQAHPDLEAAGKAYYDHRAALMIDNNEGLTKTYNRFHNPNEDSPAIAKLRALHADMDRAVLNAYGWQDIPTNCEFLLDYEIDEETWGAKKKPYRYRWPNEVRDEVLARLLELNAERAAEEALTENVRKEENRREHT